MTPADRLPPLPLMSTSLKFRAHVEWIQRRPWELWLLPWRVSIERLHRTPRALDRRQRWLGMIDVSSGTCWHWSERAAYRCATYKLARAYRNARLMPHHVIR